MFVPGKLLQPSLEVGKGQGPILEWSTFLKCYFKARNLPWCFSQVGNGNAGKFTEKVSGTNALVTVKFTGKVLVTNALVYVVEESFTI